MSVLTALYADNGGTLWAVSTNWNSGDACTNSWYGVTCDSNSEYVTAISLSGNKLKGTIVSSLSSLSKLLNLTLSENEVMCINVSLDAGFNERKIKNAGLAAKIYSGLSTCTSGNYNLECRKCL